MVPLITLSLKSKRDVLFARQRARQIAVLFHYSPQDQACIAAGAFAVAIQALRNAKGCQLRMQIDNKVLQIFPVPKEGDGNPSPTSLRLEKPLPLAAADLSPEDVAWLLYQLNRQTQFHMFEEIEHQNQEMLALLHDLRNAQAQIEQLKENQTTPFAA